MQLDARLDVQLFIFFLIPFFALAFPPNPVLDHIIFRLRVLSQHESYFQSIEGLSQESSLSSRTS